MIFDFKKGFDNEAFSLTERPIIAISANISEENSALHFAYSQSIVDAGGVPIILPANCDANALNSLMRGVDGVVLSGGDDIDARYFGEMNIPFLTELNEQRDYYEFMLLRAAINRSIPILGICRGCQVINVALGGTIYQDLPTMYKMPLEEHKILTDKHKAVHNIEINEGSKLHEIIGKNSIGVNSRHHQSNKKIAPMLTSTARSADGVEEALEGYPTHNIIAVQCHPENMATTGESREMKRLFEFAVSEANLYRRAKKIHTLNPTVDSHCDTPMLYDKGVFNFAIRNSKAKVDLPKMVEGYLDTTITVAYIPQKTEQQEATRKAFATYKRFKEDIAKLSDCVVIANSPSEVMEAKKKGLKSILLGLENGHAIGDDLANIDRLKEEGVVYITLCHNGTNKICDSAIGESHYGGVSPFGERVVERMNQLGITVDVSHSSDSSTLDLLKISRQPIIASHSSCKALCDHPRNLADTTIKAIAENGGVVQICGYNGFLKREGEASIIDYVDHIDHALHLIGYNHVGVGSDFDGGGGVAGFRGANDFLNVSVELLRRGHSEENIAKIMGGNILRVLCSNWKN